MPNEVTGPAASLSALHKLARDNGFELLEKHWLGTNAKHRFRNIKSGRLYNCKPSSLLRSGFPEDRHYFRKMSKRGKLEQLRQLAHENGYELLETEWLGVVTKHRFRHIESGREREWAPTQLVNYGFPKVMDKLEQLRQLAQDNGFELLETGWLGTATKHRFRHIESAKERELRPANLFRSGFPKDLRTDQERSAESFQKLRQLAQDNGYELLGSEWLGPRTKHRFRHINSGKEYEGYPRYLAQRGFPKEQQPKQDRSLKAQRTDQDRFAASLHKLKQLAQDNGFELLETQWLGANVKHRFRHIESGKQYEGRPGQLFFKGFPLRSDASTKFLDQIRQLARDNGFDLLETEWLGTANRHRFRHIESGKEYAWTPNHLNTDGFPKDLRTDEERSAESFLKLKQLATDNGWELLETKWLGTRVEHCFRHIESGSDRSLLPCQLYSQGFPKNPRTYESKAFEELKQKAKNEGFELLEARWLGLNKKHKFLHTSTNIEHECRPNPNELPNFFKRVNRAAQDFETLKVFAQIQGFELLEPQWLGMHKKHLFRHNISETEYAATPWYVFDKGFPRNILDRKNT